jgi:tRNA threonylcarbamoyladenosine biosynthesis protein TsaB
MAIAHSSEGLLSGIDEVLGEAGIALDQVEGLIGLRGPGSFTGLRVGLSTLLGLHQALGIPATAIPTLEVLALATPPDSSRGATVVDALRGEWFTQWLDNGAKDGEPEILSLEQLLAGKPDSVVGHNLGGLREALPPEVRVIEGGDLAPMALRFAAQREIDWSPATLLDPLYLRPPAIHRKPPDAKP